MFFSVFHLSLSLYTKYCGPKSLVNINIRQYSIFSENIQVTQNDRYPLREKCPYSKFFWSVFSKVLTEYRDSDCS